ncbi:MAG: tetratricopeptide repeat protein [Hydrococcus sp. Prado102]|jgi:tetratricopeptide (TPR) repeat protein|nr:tetratricopeptide repeat protein [Hydrococcus sp. Prado102]
MTASDSTSWRDRYLTLIEQIVTDTLQGKIRSKNQVSRRLSENLSAGTGEIFERCLEERLDRVQEQLNSQTDELKQAKANRQFRALQTIQEAWRQGQKEKQQTETIANAIAQIVAAPAQDRLLTLFGILDINQPHPLNQTQMQQLVKSLQQRTESIAEPDLATDLQQIATGLDRALESIAALEGHLVSWMYEQSAGQLGFEGVPGQRGPWSAWAKRVTSLFPQQLFQLQALNRPATELAKVYRNDELSVWVELAVILRWLQMGLVAWFDQQPYSIQWGKRLSSSTLMVFAMLWGELSNGVNQGGDSSQLARACFQLVLQIMRNFARRADFPLYGGIFIGFSGESLRNTLEYLDEPLRQSDRTQEKGRILTLLGYSQRTVGRYEQAKTFHQEALEIARSSGDTLCEIANFNHLARTCIAQQDYQTAIDHSQRALILARQTGDKVGEANALANLGYSEVLAARQQEEILSDVYERSIEYLKQSLKLSERLDDAYDRDIVRSQTQALSYNSLGIAYALLEQPQTAIEYLEKGVAAAQVVGDLYLMGLSFTYLGEAYYRLNNSDRAICNSCLGMYLLNQISAKEWRQAAGLLSIIQGQIGEESFSQILQQNRTKFLSIIGSDGFDYLPQLLEEYRRS